MDEAGTMRASLVLGVGDWGRQVLHALPPDLTLDNDLLAVLAIDAQASPPDLPAGVERLRLALPPNLDANRHVWLPSDVIARAPFAGGDPRTRAESRLLLVTGQRQLRGFFSLHVHRLNSRLQEAGGGTIEVLICAALSEVVGSGLLLDLAYLLREFLPSPERASIGALLALPHAMAMMEPDPTAWQACAYASLQELNHFTRPHALFSFHDHLGEERLATGGAPLDWSFLMFPEGGRWQARSCDEEAAAWIAGRASGEPFLTFLARPRPADSLGQDPPGTPRRFDALRTVRCVVPEQGLPELTAVHLARRALARWHGACEGTMLAADGRGLVSTVEQRVKELLVRKGSLPWLGDINQRCEELTSAADSITQKGRDPGARLWRQARHLERKVFSDLSPDGQVWREARAAVAERFGQIGVTVATAIDPMLQRPGDGMQLVQSTVEALVGLREERLLSLESRLDDTQRGDTGSKLRDARGELRRVTHSPPGLLGRLRGGNDVRLFEALGEWVRWLPRHALQEREKILTQVEIEALEGLLAPVEDRLRRAEGRGGDVLAALDALGESMSGQVEAPVELLVLPGGSVEPDEAAAHLCEELLASHPAAATLPPPLLQAVVNEDLEPDAVAAQMLQWAVPACASVRDRLAIDLVLAGAPPGTSARAVLETAIQRWLNPLLPRHEGERTDTWVVIGLPADAVGSDLDRWLRQRAESRGLSQVATFALPGEREIALFRLDLGYPIWRIDRVVETLRSSYDSALANGDATLHSRADVADWAPLQRS
jgi:hypothetical protein